MDKLHDIRLKLLIQQEHERISRSHSNDLDLSLVQARCLCWLVLLTEAHEDQANDAEKRGDAEQAMGWFADSMRLRDVINIVTSIEIPYAGETSPLDESIDNSFENNEEVTDFNEFKNENVNFESPNLPVFSKEYLKREKESKFDIDRFRNIAQSLESHCEKITRLIKLNDEKLNAQNKFNQKIFEKINCTNQSNNTESYDESLIWAREKYKMLKKKAS